MNKTIIAGVLVVALAALSGYTFTRPQPVEQAPVLGALSSPDISSPYLSFGGVRMWANGSDLRTATTSVCAIQSPAATTTLVSATARIDFAASYATQFELGKATTAFATTSRLAIFDVAASGYAAIVATSTTSGGSAPTNITDNVIAPNSWINLRLATSSTSSTFAPTGKCSVVFREI